MRQVFKLRVVIVMLQLSGIHEVTSVLNVILVKYVKNLLGAARHEGFPVKLRHE